MVKGATVLPRGRIGALTDTTSHGSRLVPRLSEILSEREALHFRTISTLPSNIEAVEAALLFTAGLESLVAIVGPSGWGKSHLLAAVSGRLRAESAGAVPDPIDVEDWIASCNMGMQNGFAIVDNVQTCMGSPRNRQMLRLLLERRVKSRRPTILSFTARGPSRQIRALLPQPRDWRIVHLKPPTPSERELVLRQMAAGEGLALSDEFIRLLARKMKGTGCTLKGALKRLKLQQVSWLSARETLRACGLLNPFFADDSSWDLREHIMKVVSRRAGERPGIPVDPVSAATYLMLREAMLSESEVAGYLKMEPKDAYGLAGLVEQRRNDDPEIAEALTRLIADVVGVLQED